MTKSLGSIPQSNKLKMIKKVQISQHFDRQQEVTLTRTRIGHSFLTQALLISKDPILRTHAINVYGT